MTPEQRYKIQIIENLIWLLHDMYGTCESRDYDDFDDNNKDINSHCRCRTCCSDQVVEFLESVREDLNDN